MSDDAITFLAVICSVTAFTSGLFTWQPQQEAVASLKAPRAIQSELPTSSTRAGDIRGGVVVQRNDGLSGAFKPVPHPG